jgi:predicted hydrocarbon binding protein
MEDVLGEKGVAAMLNLAGLSKFIGNYPPDNAEQEVSFSDYTRLCLAVEEFYGRAARGMLNRIGRAAFRYGREEHPTLFKAAQFYLKLRRPRERIRFVLNSIAKGLSEGANEPSNVTEDAVGMVLNIEYCAACWERRADRPVCHVKVGFVEEAGEWAIGSPVEVTEIACRALGHATCSYQVRLMEDV